MEYQDYESGVGVEDKSVAEQGGYCRYITVGITTFSMLTFILKEI